MTETDIKFLEAHHKVVQKPGKKPFRKVNQGIQISLSLINNARNKAENFSAFIGAIFSNLPTAAILRAKKNIQQP